MSGVRECLSTVNRQRTHATRDGERCETPRWPRRGLRRVARAEAGIETHEVVREIGVGEEQVEERIELPVGGAQLGIQHHQVRAALQLGANEINV